MKWFKHDSNANMDAKLQEVLLDYGLEGYGLYWYCIELVASKVEPNSLTFELEHDARIIARNTGSTTQKTEEMMKRFIELGLFEATGGAITCLKLAKRTDEYTAKLVRKESKATDIVPTVSGQTPDAVRTKSALLDKNRLDQIREEEKEPLSSGDDVIVPKKPVSKKEDTTPYQAIVDSYHERLPMLPRIRTLTVPRKRNIKARWLKAVSEGNDITYFDRFFDYVSGCNDFMLNSSWCNLEWIMKETNFVNLTEGGHRH